jgi:hypothetical protein
MVSSFSYWIRVVFTVGFGIVGYSQIGENKTTQNTSNVSVSIRGQNIDSDLAGIQIADQAHWRHYEDV